MEPARGDRCSPRQRQGPVAPGDDMFPFRDQESFLTSTTLTTRGEKNNSPESIPPRDKLGLMDPACSESCSSGKRGNPAAAGDDKVSSPDQ